MRCNSDCCVDSNGSPSTKQRNEKQRAALQSESKAQKTKQNNNHHNKSILVWLGRCWVGPVKRPVESSQKSALNSERYRLAVTWGLARFSFRGMKDRFLASWSDGPHPGGGETHPPPPRSNVSEFLYSFCGRQPHAAFGVCVTYSSSSSVSELFCIDLARDQAKGDLFVTRQK